MKKISVGIVVLVLVSGFVGKTVNAQQVLSANRFGYETPFQVAKPVLEKTFSEDSSIEQRRRALYDAAQKGYGTKANQLFGPGLDRLAEIEGGGKTAKNFASDNPNNRKGAAQLTRMVGAVEADGRFIVDAVEQDVYQKVDGKRKLVTDRDLVFRNRGTNSLGRIEVKDAKKTTQYSNLKKYKRQMNQMAAEMKATGQPQAFVNRRPLVPALKKHAAQLGLPAYGNVVTSGTGAPLSLGQTPINEVLDDLDRIATRAFRTRAVTAGFGLAMAAMEGRNAYLHWHSFAEGSGSAFQASYHTMNAASASSFAVQGLASTLATQVNASSRAAAILGRTARWAGPAGLILAGGAFGIQGYQWHTGQMNTRQFASSVLPSVGGLAGGLAGAAGGAGLGATLALWFPPAEFAAVPVGALVGGVAGALSVSKVTSLGVESYYSRLDKQQQEQLFEYLSSHYHERSQTPISVKE